MKGLDLLLDSAPCAFLVVDDDGCIMLEDATAAEMLDVANAASLVSRHVDFLLSTPSRIFYQTHVFPTLRLQRRVHEVYVSLVRPDGEEVPVLVPMRQRDEGRGISPEFLPHPVRAFP